MHEQGASLIYHTASAGGLGILNAGKEKNFLTVFFDGNLNADAPQTNIASAIRDFPACAQEAIQDVMDGKFTAAPLKRAWQRTACTWILTALPIRSPLM